MPISRRNFLQAGAVALLSTSAPLSLTALASRANSSKGSLNTAAPQNSSFMSKATFAPLLNTPFVIETDGAKDLEVRLIELQDLVPAAKRQQAARHGKECFSLTFRASSYEPLRQNTYRVQHATLGTFALFIGPVKSRQHGMIYEAIINHVDK